MNIHDLMIGDWVMFNPFKHENIAKHPARILFINERYFTFVQSISLDDRPGLLRPFKRDGQRGIEPIPITGEILEKSGWKHFGKDNQKPDFHGTEHWTAYKCEAWRMNDNKVFYFRIQSEDYQIQYCGKIQYVHELQHALRLCGIDLDVNVLKLQ